jgi:16S rRNA (uracil1498-N3)-methyltransferase
MTLRRWIADEHSGNTAALTGANAEHLARVLRARIGQEFAVACGDHVRLGTITAIKDGRVEFALGELLPGTAHAVTITLLLAVFKFDRFEWAIEKATELGVAKIVPAIAARTDAHLAAAAGKRVERWRRIAKEAAQQSRRSSVPEIDDPLQLKLALERQGAAGLHIVLSEVERDRMLLEAVADASECVLAIGPEGGWTPDELKLFGEYGWLSCSLGENILRAETATIAALAIAQAVAANPKMSR